MSQSNEFSVVVVGAGAAGMMAAGFAAQNGCKVTVIEKNLRVGRKLMITGKGRCNITNHCDVQTFITSVPCNGRFLYSAIHQFSPQDTIDFFEQYGLKTKTERGNRVFPQSDKAMDVVDALHDFMTKAGCKLLHGTVKKIIINGGRAAGVVTEEGKEISADAVIVTCGGMSYPGTGSTGDGYLLAKQAGHTIIPPVPSLVPLVTQEEWCKDLQGLSLRNVSVKLTDNFENQVVYEDFGEMLFTHFGVSGPIILSASSHMRNRKENSYSLTIDLKPALSFEQLDARLQRDIAKNLNKDFINSLGELLPKKMIPVIVRLSEIPADVKCNQITREMRLNLAKLLKNLVIRVQRFRPIEEAIITSGGVSTTEINPKNMESKLVKGLYFAGEVIDVDGYTGGFNLQIAFSTGWLAGNSARR